MRRLFILALALLFVSASAWGQPQLGAALNAASFMLPDLPNGKLAQGVMATLFVSGVPPFAEKQVVRFPFQLEFEGVRVQITVNGTTVDAIPIKVAGLQVTVIVPSNTPIGIGTMVFIFNGQSSNALTVEIVPHSFGIFSINEAGTGPGVIKDPFTDQPNLLTNAASPGQQWDIWGTGLTAVAGNERERALPGDLKDRLDIQVYVGGKLATIVYAGRSGCCGGIDQIRIVIPNGVSGCYVPVVVVVNRVPSNTVTLSIGSSQICSDPDGFSTSGLQDIQASGSARIVAVDLTRKVSTTVSGLDSFTTTTDSGSFTAKRYSYNSLIRAQSFNSVYARNACVVFPFKTTDSEDTPDDPSDVDPVPPDEYLDAGPSISVTNTKGAKILSKISKGVYFGTGSDSFGDPLFLEEGTHSISGGFPTADIRAFSTQMNFPRATNWTNAGSIRSIMSGTPLTLTWIGGSDVVVIFGASFDLVKNVGAFFLCPTDGAARSFTVPSYVVRAMPRSGVASGVYLGLLGLISTQTTRLDIPDVDYSFGNANHQILKMGIAYQ